MIQQETILRIADNSGARKALVIRVLGGSKPPVRRPRRPRGGGHQGRHPDGAGEEGRRRQGGDRAHRKETRRKDGSYIRFDENAAVLIDDKGEPRATRIFGPVARELREKRYMKIVSLAPEVL